MTKHSTFNFQVKQFGQEEDRTLRFIGSTEVPDRDGDIILASGWELDNYKANPVFLWAHDYSKPPIGKAIDVRVSNKQLIFDIQFPEEGVYPLADTVYKLYKGGFLNATSVGFVGKQAEPIANGSKYIRQELLELSAVPVPSNPTALQQAKSKGYISTSMQKYFDDEKVITIVESKKIKINGTEAEIKAAIKQAVQNAIRG
ncbi:HK97 family phage prohead protease [Lysinibacillus capsici]|uniref:HK97 family phage prohead protease n=1 Tax=Lysinibacillus capsici TaxID=2115968 RepID=UPI001C10763C|nr:HK97 family phage prohead protease [Lysinibacillus capsici]MBU5253333.1 HK97 family phage prohead protease [Lysinibacillus capsici]